MKDPYWKNALIALDQSIGAIFFNIPADITISAYVAFKWPDSKLENFINWLMGSKHHCQKSLDADWNNVKKYYLEK